MEGSFNNPPGSINVNQQERHSNRRLSWSHEGTQAGSQGPLLIPTLVGSDPRPLAQAQATAQAPAQDHLLAPGQDLHMSQEAINSANRKFQEEEAILAEINKQRLAVAQVEADLAATNREISRLAQEKVEEKIATEKREAEVREVQKRKLIEKKERAAKQAAEKEKADKAKQLAKEKEKAAAFPRGHAQNERKDGYHPG